MRRKQVLKLQYKAPALETQQNRRKEKKTLLNWMIWKHVLQLWCKALAYKNRPKQKKREENLLNWMRRKQVLQYKGLACVLCLCLGLGLCFQLQNLFLFFYYIRFYRFSYIFNFKKGKKVCVLGLVEPEGLNQISRKKYLISNLIICFRFPRASVLQL